MHNYYQILGLNPSAGADEIRRAYRILARRYHPDLNPGKPSEERFKLIAEAYSVLGDPAKRRDYDREFGNRIFETFRSRATAYQQAQKRAEASARERFYRQYFKDLDRRLAEAQKRAETEKSKPPASLWDQIKQTLASLAVHSKKSLLKMSSFLESHLGAKVLKARRLQKISILEVSVGMREAVLGARKTVEISEPDGAHKISLRIPPGVRSGALLRLQPKEAALGELVFVIKVAPHPFLSIQAKGLVAEIPISVHEAIAGASITVPTLEEAVVLKIPPGSQSGTELRLKEKGIPAGDGTRGDLFYRLIVKVPTCHQAVGIKDQSSALDKYYETPVRHGFPKNLLEDYL